MASWTTINLTDLLPDEPWTSAKATATYENPIAIAAGEPDAPRIAVKSAGGSIASSGNLSFTGLSDGWKGCVIHGHFKSDGSSRARDVALSNDGVTYAAASNAVSDTAGNATSFVIVVDFATGAMKVTHHANSAPAYVTATLAGAGSGVTAIRLIAGTSVSISAIIFPNGGESAA